MFFEGYHLGAWSPNSLFKLSGSPFLFVREDMCEKFPTDRLDRQIKAMLLYYSQSSPYREAWKKYVATYPNSKLLQPIENKGHTLHMSWTEVDLQGVSTEMENLPEGNYVFAILPGAKYGQWDPQRIELGAKVVEGEYSGRVQYFSYGNPEKAPSMVQAFKRLEVALVKDGAPAIETGQDPVAYLNSDDVVSKRFVGPIKYRTLPLKEGQEVPDTKADLGVFKVKSVA